MGAAAVVLKLLIRHLYTRPALQAVMGAAAVVLKL